jgi:hypothetical protein
VSPSPRMVRSMALAAAAAVVALSACNEDRSVITDPFGPPAYGFSLVRAAVNVPRGTMVFRRPLRPSMAATVDSAVTIGLAGLDSLTTGVYKVWLADVDPVADTIMDVFPATGTLTVTRTDTTLNEQGDPVPNVTTTTVDGVSTFANGGPQISVSLRANSATAGASVYPKTLVLVSIEQDAAAATPSEARPFWGRKQGDLAPGVIVPLGGADSAAQFTGVLRFGNFRANPDSQYIYNAGGRGLGSVFGNIFIATDSQIPRPPIGYYYAGYLVRRDSATNAITDTVRLGPLVSPYPNYKSLKDADVDATIDPVIQDPKLPGVPRSPLIIAGVNRISSDTVSGLTGTLPYKNVSEYQLTLEAKAGDENVASPSLIVNALMPDVIRYGKQNPQ